MGWPRDWRPQEVRNPASLEVFTERGAWHLIADLLERGQPVEVVILDNPKGKTGYVMLADIGADVPLLYIKFQLGSGVVIGRSFHYSEFARGQQP